MKPLLPYGMEDFDPNAAYLAIKEKLIDKL
jgi:hypothetical protein